MNWQSSTGYACTALCETGSWCGSCCTAQKAPPPAPLMTSRGGTWGRWRERGLRGRGYCVLIADLPCTAETNMIPQSNHPPNKNKFSKKLKKKRIWKIKNYLRACVEVAPDEGHGSTWTMLLGSPQEMWVVSRPSPGDGGVCAPQPSLLGRWK